MLLSTVYLSVCMSIYLAVFIHLCCTTTLQLYNRTTEILFAKINAIENSRDDHYHGGGDIGAVKVVKLLLFLLDRSWLAMSYSFYPGTGRRARLSDSRRTAERHLPCAEFQNAVVMCSRPLDDGEPFQVVIEKKVSMWSGSVIIGE